MNKIVKCVRVFVACLFIFVIISTISAEEISGASFVLKVYNNTIEIVSGEYVGNNQVYIVNITNNSIKGTEFNYEFLFIKNTTVSADVVQKYTDCLNEKSSCEIEKNSFNMAWNACRLELSNTNSTNCEGNLTTCTISLQQKDNDLFSKQEKIQELEEEKESKNNQKYLFGLGGIALGILGILIYRGEIGKKPKDKSEEFNPSQSG